MMKGKLHFFQMENDKTPGGDGLTTAFYKMFYYLFGKDYIKMINDCRINVQKLPESQRLITVTATIIFWM